MQSISNTFVLSPKDFKLFGFPIFRLCKPDAGYYVPDAGYYVPDAGYYVPDAGYIRKASCALNKISSFLIYAQVEIFMNKRYRIQMGQSRMGNPDKQASFGTQDTGRRQTNNIIHNTDS